MINKDNYEMREENGIWLLIKKDEIIEGAVTEKKLAKHKERKYIALIYDGILAGQYETEEFLMEDINNIPRYTEYDSAFYNNFIPLKYRYMDNGTTITYTSSSSTSMSGLAARNSGVKYTPQSKFWTISATSARVKRRPD